MFSLNKFLLLCSGLVFSANISYADATSQNQTMPRLSSSTISNIVGIKKTIERNIELERLHKLQIKEDRNNINTIKIISLAPNITENLFHLVLGNNIVGVDSLSDYPKKVQKIPKVATVSNEIVSGNTVKATVTAKSAGTATITADVNGREIEYDITVNHIAPTKKNTTAAYTQLNKYRKANKRKALKRDAKLEKIALQRAKEMAETGKFSHTRPNGKSGLTLIKGKKAKGENIAMGQTTCAQVSRDWYNSTGHRKNMLRKNFKKVGIAGYTYKGRTYWAQVFSS